MGTGVVVEGVGVVVVEVVVVVGLAISLGAQNTPAASLVSQLCRFQPPLRQSSKEDSSPKHCTSSRIIPEIKIVSELIKPAGVSESY